MTMSGWMYKPGEGRKLMQDIANKKLDYITEKEETNGKEIKDSFELNRMV